MNHNADSAGAAREYATAYALHYTARDLPAALRMYRAVIMSHPGAPEVEYSRMQITNIVAAVVTREELLDAETKLALDHFNEDGSTLTMPQRTS